MRKLFIDIIHVKCAITAPAVQTVEKCARNMPYSVKFVMKCVVNQ